MSTPPSEGRPDPGMAVGETSGSVRRRQACERCWRRKQKCDRLFPACSSCKTLELPCHERRWDLGKDRTGISHTSVASYVESLKRRLDGVDQHGGPAAKRRQTDSAGAISPSTSHAEAQRDGEATLPQAPSGGSGGDPHDESDHSLRVTMGEIGFLSRSAMAEPRHGGDWGHLRRNLKLNDRILAMLAVDGTNPSTAGASDTGRLEPIPMIPQAIVLDRAKTLPHMTRFTDQVAMQYPYLCRATLLEQHDAILHHDQSNGDVSAGQLAGMAYFDTCLAVAIGALLSQNFQSLSGFISSLHASAVQQLQRMYQEMDGAAEVHCILFLAIFSLFTPSGGSAWHLSGFAMERCISLGFHKEPDPMLRLSEPIMKDRRRLFWSAYLLDRSISTVMGRPFGIQDEDVSVKVPDEEDLSSDPREACFRYHLISQARLLSNIRANRGESPVFHYGKLCFWRELTSKFRHPSPGYSPFSDCLDQLDCRTLTQIMKLATDKHQIANFHEADSILQDIKADAITISQRLVDRMYDLSCNEHFVLSFIEAYDVFSAVITYLHATASWDHNAAQQQRSLAESIGLIQKCSTVITDIGQRFTALKSFHKILLKFSFGLIEGRSLAHGDLLAEGCLSTIPSHLISMVEARS